MEEISLFTRDGEFVAEVAVPKFKTPPDAMMRGSRLFIRREDGKYYEVLPLRGAW